MRWKLPEGAKKPIFISWHMLPTKGIHRWDKQPAAILRSVGGAEVSFCFPCPAHATPRRDRGRVPDTGQRKPTTRTAIRPAAGIQTLASGRRLDASPIRTS